ncbi:dynactin subunit 2 [Folsomia candida]|uniref:Putative dynactin subunit 2 n=1 Tax=Folsomia candida TaxID=158441 RepID=A0A226EM63_FOLCA|nr:dynactin subunit 2 [Folsomia candida]OXA58380.1 putative dynactin subunit 2 [Folsomia candida]
MADPKYVNLPGIAYDQPDIYETTDLPESDQYTDFAEVEEDSREIERVHLNPETASERFRGKYLDGSKVDFADQGFTKSRKKGYDAITCWELAPTGEQETVFQRFLRLKCEINELISEVQVKGMGADAGDPNLSAQEILKQANGMQKQLLELRIDPAKASTGNDDSNALKKKLTVKLGEMSQEKAKADKSAGSKDGLQYELCVPSSSNKPGQFSRITELENRIKMLEGVLGTEQKDKLATVAISPKNHSVLGCLSVLSTKLSLLEPTHIELIETRLSSVLQKVTKISEKKLDVQELERTLKLSDLYDLMEESSSTIQALPELAERLNSLQQLHQEASEVVKELSEIKSLQEAIAGGTLENDKILKELQIVISETLKRPGGK